MFVPPVACMYLFEKQMSPENVKFQVLLNIQHKTCKILVLCAHRNNTTSAYLFFARENLNSLFRISKKKCFIFLNQRVAWGRINSHYIEKIYHFHIVLKTINRHL